MSAISVNPAGQTFGAGTFAINELVPNAGAIFKGVPGQTFIIAPQNSHSDGAFWGIHLQNAGIKFDGLIFQGKFSIHVDYAGSTSPSFNNNEFHDADITATGGSANGTYTNNLFTGSPSSGFGLFGNGTWTNNVIANNEFTNITAGSHLWMQAGSTGNLAEQNYLSGIQNGMGFEFGTPDTKCVNPFIVQDNYYTSPNQTTNNPNLLENFMAFSLVFPTSSGGIVRRNYVNAPQRPDGIGVRIGIETAGINYLCQDNYVNGCEWGITFADGTTPASATIQHNRMFGGVNAGIRFDHPATGRVLTQADNTAATVLTWDINRLPGRRNFRLGTVVSPPVSPPPVSPPPTPSPKTIVSLSQSLKYSDGTAETITRP